MNLHAMLIFVVFSAVACAKEPNDATTSTIASHAHGVFEFDSFVYIPSLKVEVQKHEVTYRQWAKLDAEELPEHRYYPWLEDNCAYREYLKNENYNNPAGCISQNDATAFVNRINKRDAKYVYRLPTREEQIQLIDLTLKEFKKIFPAPTDTYKVLDYAWLKENSGDEPHEVCSRKLLMGLCDIVGNLAERTGQLGYGNSSSQGGTWGLSATDAFELTTPDYYFEPDSSRAAGAGFRLIRMLKQNE